METGDGEGRVATYTDANADAGGSDACGQTRSSGRCGPTLRATLVTPILTQVRAARLV